MGKRWLAPLHTLAWFPGPGLLWSGRRWWPWGGFGNKVFAGYVAQEDLGPVPSDAGWGHLQDLFRPSLRSQLPLCQLLAKVGPVEPGGPPVRGVMPGRGGGRRLALPSTPRVTSLLSSSHREESFRPTVEPRLWGSVGRQEQ